MNKGRKCCDVKYPYKTSTRAAGGIGLIIELKKLTNINKEQIIMKIKMKRIKQEPWTIKIAYGENEDA